MKTILVIADDFSGAAEMAGLGFRFGLPTRLLREPCRDVADGVTVIDTDSRSLPADRAAERVLHALGEVNARRFDVVYKKIDSVLRGPIRAEILAAMAATDRTQAVLLPQNPSRGRTIIHGEYRINGVPLDQTEFARDPEHPATTSNARRRAKLNDGDTQIEIVNADSIVAVRRAANAISIDNLPVGGADFFEAILLSHGFQPATQSTAPPLPRGRLFVCGTASAQRDMLLWRASTKGGATAGVALHARESMPVEEITLAIKASCPAVLYIESNVIRTPSTATQLQNRLIHTARAIIEQAGVNVVLAEGGATASTLCNDLNWSRFAVQREWTPGVVQLAVQGPTDEIGHTDKNVCATTTQSEPAAQSRIRTILIVKPGSYAWPDEIWD